MYAIDSLHIYSAAAMYMNFGGSGDQGCPEPSQYRVLGAASLLPHPPYWLRAQTPPQHRAPWGLSNLLGGWHIRRHLGPSLVRYLLKMVPVHGKTISNDRLGPGAWPPSSSTYTYKDLFSFLPHPLQPIFLLP